MGESSIGTGTAPDGAGDRRGFRLDGMTPRSQAEIGARAAAIWLTPRMDRLFLEGASGRRRFLDRLVLALDAGHAREVAAYETAMAQRNRLLTEGFADAAWLAALEDAMARHGVAATAARVSLVHRMNDAASAERMWSTFPATRIGLACEIADRLATAPALEAEEWLRSALATNRRRDADAGSARIGAHRTVYEALSRSGHRY